jgi:hypothetical protein
MTPTQSELNNFLLPPSLVEGFIKASQQMTKPGSEAPAFRWVVVLPGRPKDTGHNIGILIEASLRKPLSAHPIYTKSIPTEYAIPKKSVPIISWQWVRTAAGAVSTPFSRTLSQIDSLCEQREPLAEVPTQSACASARLILSGAHQITKIAIEPTAVETSEGDILIHWDLPTRSVVLICPGTGRTPSIYRETLDGVLPSTSELQADATARSLSEALAWVLPPQ